MGNGIITPNPLKDGIYQAIKNVLKTGLKLGNATKQSCRYSSKIYVLILLEK